MGTDVSLLQPELQPGPEAAPRRGGITAGESEWGGWGSNPRPADYEKRAPVLPVRYLHGYHRVVPQIALIAPFARMTRSTNRSTPTMATSGGRSQNVTADRARYASYGRRATWSIWTTCRSSPIV